VAIGEAQAARWQVTKMERRRLGIGARLRRVARR